jgi:hypothetical protein
MSRESKFGRKKMGSFLNYNFLTGGKISAGQGTISGDSKSGDEPCGCGVSSEAGESCITHKKNTTSHCLCI